MNLPPHWKKTTLGKSCDFLNGKAHEQNIDKNGDFVVVNSKFIASEGATNKKTNAALFPLFKNDIAMVMSDVPKGRALAKCYLIDQDNKYSLNQRICVIRSTKFDFKFLFYQLNRNQYFLQFDDGDSQTNLRKEDILNCPLYLPPIAEQKRIAAILDKADAIRRKRQEAIKLTEELGRSLFLDMFGDPVTNPKGWEVKKLGDLCTIVRGGSPRPINDYLGGTIPWIKIGDATDGDDIYISKTAEAIKPEGVQKSRYLEPGALIFANCGVSLGFARILKIGGCIHDGWLAFSNLDSCINQIFLLKSLNQITQYFRAIAPDGTQPNLNTAIMKTFDIPVPPTYLQEKFVSMINTCMSSQQKQKTLFDESENLFNSLLQRAFKGEL